MLGLKLVHVATCYFEKWFASKDIKLSLKVYDARNTLMYLTVPLGYCSEYMLSLNIGLTGLSEITRMSEIRRLYPIIYIYTNMSSSRHHILAISPAVKIYRVGDNRRTVNTSTTPHISDQLGTENVCKTLLCWFIVMIRILVCNNMYQNQHRFWSFYHNPRRFRFIVGKWVNTGYFFFFF